MRERGLGKKRTGEEDWRSERLRRRRNREEED